MGGSGMTGGHGRGYTLLSMNLPMCFWKLVLGRGKGTMMHRDGEGKGGKGKGRVVGRKLGSGGGYDKEGLGQNSSSSSTSSSSSSSSRGSSHITTTTGTTTGIGTNTAIATGSGSALVDLDDVAGLDATLYKSLLHVRDNEGVEDLCLTFEAPIEELVLQATATTTGGGLRGGGINAVTHQNKGYPFPSTTTTTTTAFSFSGVVRKSDEGVRRCSSGTSGNNGTSLSSSSQPVVLDLEAKVVGVSFSRCVPLISKKGAGSGQYPPMHVGAGGASGTGATGGDDGGATAVTDANKESYLAAVVTTQLPLPFHLTSTH